MQPRLAWALPLLLATVACKKQQPTETPVDEQSSSRSGYGTLAWSESPSDRTIPPLEVCEHLARMVAAEAGMSEVDVDQGMMAECEADLAVEAGIRGTDNWNDIAQCVLQARTEADIDACDRAYPLPNQAGSGSGNGSGSGGGGGGEPGPELGVASERELGVCEHMIEILMLESAAELGEVPQLTRDERDALIQECAQSLAYEQRAQRSPAEYERMLGCIEAAQSSDQMRVCE